MQTWPKMGRAVELLLSRFGVVARDRALRRATYLRRAHRYAPGQSGQKPETGEAEDVWPGWQKASRTSRLKIVYRLLVEGS